MISNLMLDVNRFLRTGEGEFGPVALSLFEYQFERNAPYRSFCEAQGKTPGSFHRWEDIPAVPIDAFKSSELCTFPVGRASAVFHSSATTTGSPSRHFIKDLSYYETSLQNSFSRWVLKGDLSSKFTFFILTPSPAEAPHSSLSWMMDVVKRARGNPDSDYFVQRGRLDKARLSRRLRQAETSGQPIILLGTTIAFLSFFDFLERKNETFHVANGSRLMDTGGMKTSKHVTTHEAFLCRAKATLGIVAEDCLNEYGMCELGSQFYSHGASSHLTGPSWTRTRVIDPVTGGDALEGASGLLCHYDLANVDSVLAIQTEDMGISDADGFTFQGRAPAAALKGCSMSAEEFLK